MAKVQSVQSTVTMDRLRRLAKLIKLLGKNYKPRAFLLEKLKVDQRSFFRDIKLLRGRGIGITIVEEKYKLDVTPEEAFDLLPAPPLEISMADLKVLAKGNNELHRRMQLIVEKLTTGTSASATTKAKR